MKRGAWTLAALAGALVLAVLGTRPPSPGPADAPADSFSAARAMRDIGAIAAAPHPSGSSEQARVGDYLTARLRAMGLETSIQSAPLGPRARDRLRQWKTPADQGRLANIVARLPGSDPTQPAVLLMAHYDTVAGSPGAADDGAGVAAILEVVRALRAGPTPRRDLLVVFTDAEEPGLDGARVFFAAHPWASRAGVVVNLEARGGGGRALMFETGAENGAMMALYGRAVRRPSAHSLAVLIYRLMPNSSDFTIAKARGLPGFNFAFMGGADQYHSPTSTPKALSRGSLQHMGSQALDLARALTQAPALPPRAPDAVFADALGLHLILYPAWMGWLVLAASGGLLLVAWKRVRGGAAPAGVLGGAGRAVVLLLHAVLALDLFNRLSGAGPTADYFDRLAALPRLEAQAVLVGVAALIGALALRRGSRGRVVMAAPAALLLGLEILLGAAAIPVGAIALVAGGLWMVLPKERVPAEWVGALALLLLIAAAIQVVAPTASPLVAWPLLAGCASAAIALSFARDLEPGPGLWAPAVATLLAGAQVLAMAHFAFLGVGAELAPAMAVFVLLIGVLMWPLAPRRLDRGLVLLLALLLATAGGLALSVRLDPPAASVPAWSD